MVVLLKIGRTLAWVVYALALGAIIVLAFAFVLVLFNANENVSFAQFIAKWAEKFMGPFLNIIPPTKIGDSVIVWSALIAIAAYAVLAWLASLVASQCSIGISRYYNDLRVAAAAESAAHQAAAAAAVSAAAHVQPAAFGSPVQPTSPPIAAPVAPVAPPPAGWPAGEVAAAPVPAPTSAPVAPEPPAAPASQPLAEPQAPSTPAQE